MESFKKADEHWLKWLGDNHPFLAMGWHNQGQTLMTLGKLEEAEEMLKKSMDHRLSFGFPANHPENEVLYKLMKQLY